MYSEDDLLPLSALQHLLFCERQCALIHIEQVWDENRLTAEGRILHERVHERDTEHRQDVRVARGVRLRSLRLGLSGIADVVEFHRADDSAGACPIPGADGLWAPFPVEYKRGRPKRDSSDEVQLCAQAICLEEMLGAAVPTGALFYGKTKRRKAVLLDGPLRRKTEDAANRLHLIFESGVTPPARYEKKCDNCSLLNMCLPKTAGGQRSAVSYLSRMAQP